MSLTDEKDNVVGENGTSVAFSPTTQKDRQGISYENAPNTSSANPTFSKKTIEVDSTNIPLQSNDDPGRHPTLLLDAIPVTPQPSPEDTDKRSQPPRWHGLQEKSTRRSLQFQPHLSSLRRREANRQSDEEARQQMNGAANMNSVKLRRIEPQNTDDEPKTASHADSSSVLQAARRSLIWDEAEGSLEQQIQQAQQMQDIISRAETISMFAVHPGEDMAQQQDIFINNWIEDISLSETLPLPIVKLVRANDISVREPLQGTKRAFVPETPPTQEAIKKQDEERALADKRKVVASTASGAAIAGIGDLVSAVLKYATTVLMTNLFAHNINIYGDFVETNTIVTVLGYASKLGFDSTTLRFLSTYRAKGQRGKAAALIRFASLIAILSGIIWGVMFFFTSFALSHYVFKKDDFDLPFKEAVLLVPLIGIQLVTSATLQAFKAIKWKVYVDRLIQPGVTLILVVLFYKLGMRLEALILATTCGYVASVAAGQFFVGKAKKKMVQGVKPEYDVKTWMKFAFPMFFNSMIRNILNSTDVLFLGAVATETQLAFYGAADRVSYFVVAPLIALNAIFSPVIAEYHARGEHRQLEMMFKLVTKWSISLSFPVFLICVVFRTPILGIFTEKYTAAGLVLVVLALGNFVDAGVGSVNYLLTMTGRPRIILANTVATVVVNVLLALILVPRFNIMGAALAAALTVIILNTVGLIEVYVVLKIHPYRLDTLKPIAAGLVAAAAGFGLTRIIQVGYGHDAIPMVLVAFLVPFLAVYIGVLILLRFGEEDKMVFDMVLAKFGKGKKKTKDAA